MTTRIFKPSVSRAFPRVTAAFLALTLASAAEEPPKPIKKDKLQIVFVMGQSNMVGLADIGTSWHLTQPQYVPPKDLLMKKSDTFEWGNFFWQGVRYYQGPAELEKQLAALLDERGVSRGVWRNRVKNQEWQDEWGPKPEVKGRNEMYAFLDKKAKEEGIYSGMAKILEGPENQNPMEKAYQEIVHRDEHNAEQIKRVKEIYMNGTKAEDFGPFLSQLDLVRRRGKKGVENAPEGTPEEVRQFVAKLGEDTVNLPIAKHTHIYSHGAFESSMDNPIEATAHGPLSIGWGGGVTTIGPEYGIGITLERLVDAPILLVKCSWGNTAIREAWRPGSLDGVETPTEKAQREAANALEAARAKEEGREPKPRPAPEKTGKPSWAWNMAMPAVREVLKNPGKYHPEYNPEKGYDIAGMVWFQGYSDMNNEAYGEQLDEMIKWFRKEINAPEMPFVAGSLGVGSYYHNAFKGYVNEGMVKAALSPDLKGSVDIVNTGRFYPLELDAADNIFLSMEKGTPEQQELNTFLRKTTSNKPFHYRGSAKFFLLTGDAMARSLANLMAGGEPTILEESKAR
jgi:hypothetical protein